ncbi:hypothetical protein [Oceanicoccus sagamiensis]|uniref:Uncharacterized protein n=1 Tax=Oceanicoccus sagamiensis TaxID=716816 RepID=A0A1X9NC14_9GAMM|nr:hypothetical protein [Oceanicoccus sagamiensis]ARN74584.1 hypothetical protein BST96_10900 [Oceanicoccus sagamiensis]
MHDNILKFKNGRYFFITVAMLAICFAIYATQGGKQPANGGTWQGYVLGTLGAVLIVWLTALGKRKRNYSSRLGSMQGWASAHVYLGTSLLIVATLHCAVQFGYNVHTLAYGLMCLVIFSGFGGVYVYMRYPSLSARNRANSSRAELFAELASLNESVRKLSKNCDPQVHAVVDSAIDRTNIGGGAVAQLMAIDASQMLKEADEDSLRTAASRVSNKDQQAVVDFIAQRIPRSRKQDESATLQELLTMLCRRQALLRKIRKDIQLQGWMQIWLYLHIPLTIALLFALAVHIIAVFFYW